MSTSLNRSGLLSVHSLGVLTGFIDDVDKFRQVSLLSVHSLGVLTGFIDDVDKFKQVRFTLSS